MSSNCCSKNTTLRLHNTIYVVVLSRPSSRWRNTLAMHFKETMMNNRLCAVMTAMTLIICSTGCSGMKNFLFGRGARCGLCSSLGSRLPVPRFGNVMQAPLAAPSCQAPACQAPAYAPAPAPAYSSVPECGCNAYAGQSYSHDGYASGTCGSCGDSYVGTEHQGYAGYDLGTSAAPIYSDPYLNSSSQLGPPPLGPGERIIGTQPIPQTSVPGRSYPTAPIQPDGFQARKFDSDGNKILWEEPLPSGTTAL